MTKAAFPKYNENTGHGMKVCDRYLYLVHEGKFITVVLEAKSNIKEQGNLYIADVKPLTTPKEISAAVHKIQNANRNLTFTDTAFYPEVAKSTIESGVTTLKSLTIKY